MYSSKRRGGGHTHRGFVFDRLVLYTICASSWQRRLLKASKTEYLQDETVGSRSLDPAKKARKASEKKN